ncbi:(d)CMP kinase [Candidatus Albibeggiatoa sp. nov. NOAA]|uniref:(d)CMP kinase n=1 Tax=Candidatus Albibeggiatoa sp. nov. NOAA TaxID=3162724 RepID=UPI0032FBA29F|nr:(d)CMP kinase [Thiotrichaceae bacterium]
MTKHIPIITIDGPSGVGKGTVTLQLAKHLNWHILDSGAIYRVLAYAAQKHNLQPTQEPELAQLASNLDLQFQQVEDAVNVILDNENVTDDLRTESCGNFASKIAALSAVRQALLQRQRDFLQTPGLIADGRDMGTVVFPDAPLKLFLTASAEERGQRRYKQLKQKGINVNIGDLINDIAERDKRDTQRTVAPLKPAADALVIDTTTLSIEEVMQQVLALVNKVI